MSEVKSNAERLVVLPARSGAVGGMAVELTVAIFGPCQVRVIRGNACIASTSIDARVAHDTVRFPPFPVRGGEDLVLEVEPGQKLRGYTMSVEM